MTVLVQSTLRDGVATLTLNRPDALNALSPDLMIALVAALRECTADVVLAGRSAYFLVPQVSQLGIVPDLGATWALSRLLGRGRALGMALLGERIDAPLAEQWGLIWRCVDDSDLSEQAYALAQRLGRTSAAAVRDTRKLIDSAPANTLAQQLNAERMAQLRHVAGDFFNTACARFLARARHN